MPLKLVQRHGSPFWYIRGSVRGIRVDESTGLSDRGAAEEARILREAELVHRSIHGDSATRTFAEAALSYMEAGGERTHLTPLLKHFGSMRLALGDPYADRDGKGGGQIKTAWATMLKRAEIADFTPHDCRHTWATWHYRENRDLGALMELGGWKSAAMVMRYAHVNTSHLAGSVHRIWGNTGDHRPEAIVEVLPRKA